MSGAAGRPGALGRIWWSPSPGLADRVLLAPLSVAEVVFRLGVALRGTLYDRGVLPAVRAKVPVISVGNLSVGGAGKTPAVLALAERLLAAGRRPAVLSRGYGSEGAGPRVVSDGQSLLLPASQGGDEPVLLAHRLPRVPVVCGPDRAALARIAVDDLGADVLVLDDGFQHRHLRRDLDIVVLDASNPFGNGHCLPRGPNREPPGALSRAGLLWLTHADGAPEGRLAELRAAARRFTGRDPVESRHAPRELLGATLERSYGLDSLSGARVALLTGVARPENVRRTVESLGASVIVCRHYPDHHPFTESELAEVLGAAARAGASPLVTTEKDAVRLPRGWRSEPRLRVLRIEAEVLRGGASLEAAVAEALQAGGGPGGRA